MASRFQDVNISFFIMLKPFSTLGIWILLAAGCFACLSLFFGCHAADLADRNDSQWRVQPLLKESWTFFKGRFLVDGNHVVSNTYGGTISEGQSYAMLKAVWMDDPQTFEKVWQWTRRELKRPHDALLGWRWGEREDGTTGLLEIENATDADQDIAYALLLAGERWRQPAYIADARRIIADLWRLDVAAVGGRYYLVPGTWEGFREEVLTLDPSYLAPYVYRKFAAYDPAHATGWNSLADGVYDTLEACSALSRTGLPPNWCAVPWGAPTGKPHPVRFSDKQGEGARDFSYDAFRVFWRMGMDARLSPAPGRDRARAYLRRHQALITYWREHGTLPEGFSPEGQALGDVPTSGFAMAAALAQNHALDPAGDAALYRQMLAPHYHSEGYWFNDYNDYLHSVIWLHLYTLSL